MPIPPTHMLTHTAPVGPLHTQSHLHEARLDVEDHGGAYAHHAVHAAVRIGQHGVPDAQHVREGELLAQQQRHPAERVELGVHLGKREVGKREGGSVVGVGERDVDGGPRCAGQGAWGAVGAAWRVEQRAWGTRLLLSERTTGSQYMSEGAQRGKRASGVPGTWTGMGGRGTLASGVEGRAHCWN